MPPSAFFCEIGSSSRCRGPLFHNCPTKPEQTRASVQGSHASPRLPDLLRLAGAPLSPRAPCHPGAAVSASPSSFRSREVPRPRDPGAVVCVSPWQLDARVQDVLQEHFCLWTSQAAQ